MSSLVFRYVTEKNNSSEGLSTTPTGNAPFFISQITTSIMQFKWQFFNLSTSKDSPPCWLRK